MSKSARFNLANMLSYRLMSSGKFRQSVFTIIIALIFLFSLWDHSFKKFLNIFPMSAINVYERAQKLRIDGAIDPPCEWSIKYKPYVCSGHCPWVTKKAIKCAFLPRTVNRDFQENSMYCTPPPDNCLSYNAWLKEKLPLTMNPVRAIPAELLSDFTLNGLIPVNYSIGFQFSNYSGSELNWSQGFVNSYRNQVKQRQPFGTYQTTALYPVLEAYSERVVRHKKCAVIGSEYPWIEAALLEFEASNVTTVEYSRIMSDVPNLLTITPNRFAAKQQKDAVDGNPQLFDSVWCYSTLEHDGLGRYTDPINPYGDFQTMIKFSCMLKPGGLLFLAVPLHKYDSIHFNLHRVYGPIRLPLLYRYFHVVQVFDEGSTTNLNNVGWQPIVVLQNKIGCE
jgi:hypothetical protein